MTFEAIIRDIKNKIYHPVYFFYGEEPFYTDKLVDLMENNILTEAEKSFNFTMLYGKEVNAGQVMETARRLPMMANHNLVILKEAQQMRTLENLDVYVNKPVESTILVISYKHKKPDKRKKFFKQIIASAVAHESPLVRDYELEAWIGKHVSTKGLHIDQKASMLLADHIGTDLSRIDHELDKLIINKGEDKKITAEDIEQFIGISKEFNVFELVNALGRKDGSMVNKIIKNFELNPKNHPMPLIMFNLYQFFVSVYKLHYHKYGNDNDVARKLGIRPFLMKQYKQAASLFPAKRIESIMELLLQYDLKSKGVGNPSVSDMELLKEMAYKIYSK